MRRTCLNLLLTAAVVALLFVTPAAWAQSLGTASSFAVLGSSTVTNTGATTVTGDLGTSPGTAITGFPPGIVTGTTHAGDATAGTARGDVITAYNFLAAQPCPGGNNLTGTDLGGLTLTPGVYCFSSSAQLTGTLTLDAGGNAAAVFIFQIGSTLTTASNARVIVINGGTNCNVWWQVGSSATLGTTTAFVGNILALTSITLNTGAGISGRALARNGAVTLDTNAVNASAAACAAPPPPGPPPPPSAVTCPPVNALTAGGAGVIETVTLTAPAPAGGTIVTLTSSAPGTASVPISVVVPAGATSASFTITPGATPGSVTITATTGGGSVTCTATVGPAFFTGGAGGGPTLDPLGLSILVLLLAAAGVLLVNRMRM